MADLAMQILFFLSITFHVKVTNSYQWSRSDWKRELQPHGGNSGSWSTTIYCNSGTFGYGFRQKVEDDCGALCDDTAMNSLQMVCSNGEVLTANLQGGWGSWGSYRYCQSSIDWMRGLVLRVDGDNTGLNDVQAVCNSGTVVHHTNGETWGSWSAWKYCFAGEAVCGFRQRIESDQGSLGDDSAANSVYFECCDMPTPQPTKNPTPSPTNYPTPAPTKNPTPAPTNYPTPAPSNNPTPAPTNNPTPTPTNFPTQPPTNAPTYIPTVNPTNEPTLDPTTQPTNIPTTTPTPNPTSDPTFIPTGDAGAVNEFTTTKNENENENEDNKSKLDHEASSSVTIFRWEYILTAVLGTILVCALIAAFCYRSRRKKIQEIEIVNAHIGQNVKSNDGVEGIDVTSITYAQNIFALDSPISTDTQPVFGSFTFGAGDGVNDETTQQDEDEDESDSPGLYENDKTTQDEYQVQDGLPKLPLPLTAQDGMHMECCQHCGQAKAGKRDNTLVYYCNDCWIEYENMEVEDPEDEIASKGGDNLDDNLYGHGNKITTSK